MFEGLDQVNWGKLRHAYGLATDVPKMLQSLVDTIWNEEEMEEAFGHLVNHINHQGSIYSATAPTVPFLLQLIKRPTLPKREWLLYTLVALMESCNAHVSYRTEISTLEDEYAVFTSIRRGTSIYLGLLNDPDDKIRGITAHLLALVRDQRPAVRLHLWRAAEMEQNDTVRARMIYGVGKLVPWRFSPSLRPIRKRYRDHFLALADSEESPIIRLASAAAWIESERYVSLSPAPIVIPHTLADALVRYPRPGNKTEFIMLDDMLTKEHIIDLLKRLGIKGLIEGLHTDSLTAEAAYELVPELLDVGFRRLGPNYPVPNSALHDWQTYTTEGSLTKPQRTIIDAVVNCEIFWQVPTYMFSLFYGLPDSREELRALLYSP